MAGTAPVVAQDQSVRPGVNAHYEDADFERWQRIFERPGREVYDRRDDVVAELGLRPGMAVADVGAGTGLFTRLMAREVGADGVVYAVDITPGFVEKTVATSHAAGLPNVRGIVNTPRDVALPESSVDLVFVCATYHHFEYPRSMLQSIRQALREDGRLVVVDFRRVPGRSSAWVLDHVRAGAAVVRAEIEAEGFRLLADRPVMAGHFFLEFARD